MITLALLPWSPRPPAREVAARLAGQYTGALLACFLTFLVYWEVGLNFSYMYFILTEIRF